MLENGHADYVIDYAGPASEVLADTPIAGIGFDVLAQQEVYLVLSKTYPDAQLVMDRLEAIAATLDLEGIPGRHAMNEKKDAPHKGTAPVRPR